MWNLLEKKDSATLYRCRNKYLLHPDYLDCLESKANTETALLLLILVGFRTHIPITGMLGIAII